MSSQKKWNLLLAGFTTLASVAALSGSFRGMARRHGAAGQKPIAALQGHTMPVQALAFGPDGSTLSSAAFFPCAARSGVEVTVWDATAALPLSRRVEHPDGPLSLAFSPDTRRVAVVTRERGVWLGDVVPEGQRQTLPLSHVHGRAVWLGEASPPRDWRLCELRTLVHAPTFSPDGGELAAADWDHHIIVVDASDGRQKDRFPAPSPYLNSVAFAPRGTLLASGGQDGIVRLWDRATGEQLHMLQGPPKSLVAVAFSPDGRTLAGGDIDGGVRLWDVTSRAERLALATDNDDGAVLAFAPDGRTLAVAAGRLVQLWDAHTGALLAHLEGHEKKVKCLAFSPDGSRLASGSYDYSLLLWRLVGGRPPGQ